MRPTGRLAAPLAAAALIAILVPALPAAASIGSSVSDGRLSIDGDGGDDIVTVTCVNGRAKVNGANPGDGPIDCDQLLDVYVTTFGGSDTVDLTGVTAGSFPKIVEPTVYAGEGDDVVTASPIATGMWGGAGEDTLNGGPGPDRLSGDAGIDAISGSGGRDTVGGELHGEGTLTDSDLTDGLEVDTLSGIEAAALTASGRRSTARPSPARNGSP